jgi:hypothetical protein
MRTTTLIARCFIATLVTCLVLPTAAARAQISGTDVNLSAKNGDDSECAVAKNPSNPTQLFALCNTAGPGLLAARSSDGGVTWTYPDPTDKTIADGGIGQGPAACCDPTLAWDTFGNLFITYIDAALSNIVTIISTNGGATFANLASFGPANVDQPTVVAANTTAAGAPVAVWIVWNQGGQMVARGAAVTALGVVGAFGALQIIPGTANCSFGDVAIAPSGAVVQACGSPTGGQGPSTIRINTDADGLGPGNFGAAVAATTSNVGGFDFIPAQNARSVDPEAGLAFDSFAISPRFGRLYLVYTEETAPENNDTDIMVRFSNDNGATWSAPIRVNDDPAAPIRSQFLPRIAVSAASGDIVVCWHDARNSAANTGVQQYCSSATAATATPAFSANALVSDGSSTSNGIGVEFGDYAGLAYVQGVWHPIWGDASNSTGNNPNATANFDAYTDAVSWPTIVVNPCLPNPRACVTAGMRPGHVLLYCVIGPCVIRDPLPRNCLVKFGGTCPGCDFGYCPPFYTYELGNLNPSWHVGLFDPRDQPVPFEQRRTKTGMLISFRPSPEYFKNGKIGDYYFTFETSDPSLIGKEQAVRMSLRAGKEPFGRMPSRRGAKAFD